MSRNKGKLIVVVLAFVVLTMASLACNETEDVSAASKPTPNPAQIKNIAMENAYEFGKTIFVFPEYDETEGRYALCNGMERIVFLRSGSTKTIVLTTQEAANLSLCREAESGYNNLQSLHGSQPGDYYEWGSDMGLGVTPYSQ